MAVLAVFGSVDLMIRVALSFSGISMTTSLNLKSLMAFDLVFIGLNCRAELRKRPRIKSPGVRLEDIDVMTNAVEGL